LFKSTSTAFWAQVEFFLDAQRWLLTALLLRWVMRSILLLLNSSVKTFRTSNFHLVTDLPWHSLLVLLTTTSSFDAFQGDKSALGIDLVEGTQTLCD
jgi:hypothetical protein